MNDHEANFEKNLGQLLKASCGPETGAPPAARERLRRELVSLLRHRRQPAEFPGAVLGLLTVLVLLLFAAWGACAWPGGAGLVNGLPSGPISALVIVNLVAIPVASFVIVLRRKYA
jgi:hypothetical protein